MVILKNNYFSKVLLHCSVFKHSFKSEIKECGQLICTGWSKCVQHDDTKYSCGNNVTIKSYMCNVHN